MMEREQIAKIKEKVNDERTFARKIMDGDQFYDGADGARSVLALCRIIDELLLDIPATGSVVVPVWVIQQAAEAMDESSYTTENAVQLRGAMDILRRHLPDDGPVTT